MNLRLLNFKFSALDRSATYQHLTLNLLFYYIKEIYFKILVFIFILLLHIFIIIIKSKEILIYILLPIKKIKLEEFKINYNIEKIEQFIEIKNQENIFLPIIEINLPFFTTSYIFIKYLILLLIYLIIPFFLYIIYISMLPILKKVENKVIKWVIISIIIFIPFNIILIQYIIMPLFISFIYQHYIELLYYEFDVEFQLINYLNLYFILIYTQLCFFITIIIKKHIFVNINLIVLILITLFILPSDIIFQIIILINIIFINIIIKLSYNYYNLILIYKQKKDSKNK